MASEQKPDWGTHVEIVSASIGLPIDPAFRQGVVDNLTRIGQIAQGFLSFPLEDDTDPATRFEP